MMNTVAVDVTRLSENYGLIKMEKTGSVYNQTLLLVDDEQNVLSSLQRLFRSLPCKVVVANSGQEAIQKMAEHCPDMIISDVRMPGMDGVELLSIVARDYPETERLLLTGYADLESTIASINDCRVSHFIQKPWDDDFLLELVQKTLGQLDLYRHNEQLQETIKNQNEQLKNFNTQLEEKVRQSSEALIQTNTLLEEASAELRKSYHNFVELFIKLVDARVGEFYKDSHQASRLAMDIGKSLGLPREELQALHFAAKLRHIGLLELSDEVIKTPFDSMTDEQRRSYQQYPILSHALLCSQPALHRASEIILMHRERLDGKGFPARLESDDIDLPARILGVVNDYLYMISGAFTEEPYTVNDAVAALSARKGVYYSEEVLAALEYLVENDGHEVREQRVSPRQLKAAMVLSRDLHNQSGSLLLAKGTMLEESIVAKIEAMEARLDERFELYVYC